MVAVVVAPPEPDVTENRRIPSNSASIKLTGSGFGLETSELSVLLLLTPISSKRSVAKSVDCLPTFANETSLICSPLDALIDNAFVDARISLLGGASPFVRVGVMAGSIVVNSSIDYQIVAQNADTIFIYGEGFAPGADYLQNSVSLTPGGPCSVRSATFTVIECGVSQPFGSVTNVKALVASYGTQPTGPVPVIAQVVPTASIFPSLSPISHGASGVQISGAGFDPSSLTSTRVWLSLNNANEVPCDVTFINQTFISCAVAVPFNSSGTLTGKVRSFFGNSTHVNVGRVVDPSGSNGTGNVEFTGASQATVIGASVGAVAFATLVAVIVIIVILRRIKAIKNITGESTQHIFCSRVRI